MPSKKPRKQPLKKRTGAPDTLEVRFERLLEREGLPKLPRIIDRKDTEDVSTFGLSQHTRKRQLDDNKTDEERLEELIHNRALVRQEGDPGLEATIEVEEHDGADAPGEPATIHGDGVSWGYLHVPTADFWRGRWSRLLLIEAEDTWIDTGYTVQQINERQATARQAMDRIERLVTLTDLKFGPWFVHQRKRAERPIPPLTPRERSRADLAVKVALHYIVFQEPCRAYIGRLTLGSTSRERLSLAQLPA